MTSTRSSRTGTLKTYAFVMLLRSTCPRERFGVERVSAIRARGTVRGGRKLLDTLPPSGTVPRNVLPVPSIIPLSSPRRLLSATDERRGREYTPRFGISIDCVASLGVWTALVPRFESTGFRSVVTLNSTDERNVELSIGWAGLREVGESSPEPDAADAQTGLWRPVHGAPHGVTRCRS